MIPQAPQHNDLTANCCLSGCLLLFIHSVENNPHHASGHTSPIWPPSDADCAKHNGLASVAIRQFILLVILSENTVLQYLWWIFKPSIGLNFKNIKKIIVLVKAHYCDTAKPALNHWSLCTNITGKSCDTGLKLHPSVLFSSYSLESMVLLYFIAIHSSQVLSSLPFPESTLYF